MLLQMWHLAVEVGLPIDLVSLDVSVFFRLTQEPSSRWFVIRAVAVVVQSARNLVRLVTLMLLFTPVVLMSPLACYFTVQRSAWLYTLR